MTTLYLLPTGIQEVQYSFIKHDLESLLIRKGLPNSKILSVDIDEQLASQLTKSSEKDLKIYHYEIGEEYYIKQENFLDNPPQWFKEDGMRIYIIFNVRHECYWSPSGNNLNSFYDRNPERYLSRAIRVNLEREDYINIYAYSDYRIDSF